MSLKNDQHLTESFLGSLPIINSKVMIQRNNNNNKDNWQYHIKSYKMPINVNTIHKNDNTQNDKPVGIAQ